DLERDVIVVVLHLPSLAGGGDPVAIAHIDGLVELLGEVGRERLPVERETPCAFELDSSGYLALGQQPGTDPGEPNIGGRIGCREFPIQWEVDQVDGDIAPGANILHEKGRNIEPHLVAQVN